MPHTKAEYQHAKATKLAISSPLLCTNSGESSNSQL